MDTELLAQNMPYAPPSAVVAVIRRYRDRGLPEPVTGSTLQQVSVSSGNASRTLQALKFLGLVDEEGYITDSFKRLRSVNTKEYPSTLAEMLHSKYKQVFNVVDPAQDDMTDIEDAFRGSKPEGQRQRMVTLFLGLCSESEIVSEDKAPKMQPQSRQQRPSKRATSQQNQKKPSSSRKTQPTEEPKEQETREKAVEYPVVQGIVEQLPKDGVWTQKRRDLWVQAMVSTVDLAVEVREPEEVYEGEVMPELELE